jgi:phosphoenolpyruvate carboxykinase (GTP)
LWAELRVHGDVEAIETPTGLIPKYEDLAGLFKRELGTDYTKENYIEQFSTRVVNLLAKIGRVEEIYKAKVPDTPQIVFDVFKAQRERLNAAKDKLGECISPFDL